MPKLPDLAPKDMAWLRWVDNTLQDHNVILKQTKTQTAAANIQRNGVSSALANTNQSQQSQGTVLPQVPVGAPQTPTEPTLATDHGTVTIHWDGLVYTNSATTPPNTGFNHVNVQRSPNNIAFTQVGTDLGVAGTVVDADVVVGQTYYYRLVTSDNLRQTSAPSNVVSVVVKGVDKGGLDSSLSDLFDDLQTSATTGGKIYYGVNPPSDPAYQTDSAIWFDESDPTGAVAKKWDANTNTWVAVPYGNGAFGEGSINASNIVAGAIDTDKLHANAVTANKIGAGEVTAEKLAADSVTANSIAAGSIDADKISVGAITADKLSLGAALPSGTQINRVPKPLNQADYWTDVISGAIDLNPDMDALHPDANVFATSGGIVMVPTATQDAYLTVTTTLQVPDSGSVHVKWSPAGTNVIAYLQTFTSAGVPNNTQALTNGQVMVFASTSATYCVYLFEQAGSASATVNSLQVFEVIGSAIGSQQSAQLSPSGLRLYNDAGQLSVDLSTSTTNFFTIMNQGEAVATVDEDGNGTFSSVQVNEDYFVDDNALVGVYPSWQRNDGPLDGPLLERLPRGVIYQSNWTSLNNLVVNTQYQRIATGSFNLDPGRQYMLMVDLGGLQTTNASGVNVYVELQLSTVQLQNVQDGTVFARSVVYNGDTGYWALPPISLRADTGLSLSPNSNTLPANTDIYWQINTNLSTTPTSAYTLSEFSASTGLTILDVGPAFVALSGTDRTTSGATATGSAGSGGSGSSTSKSTTKTWTASWSASWNQSGSNKVTGTGTYTDAQRLYQGLGASNMGAKFGFSNNVVDTLAGKTISKVEVFLQNRWTWANSGGSVELAGHGSTSAGSTFGSTTSGTGFSESFTRGQGRWFTISNSTIPFSSWKSGSIRGLALVVEGGDSNYCYFDGVGKSAPPKLRITYS